MQKYLKRIELLLYFFCLYASQLSCSPTRCKSFFEYKSTTVDIKGINAKLLKNGVKSREVSIGSILIDPKFTQTSEELKKLDIYQKTLCEQLNLIKSDSLREIRRGEYIEALLKMMRIANNPDSLLNNRVTVLEKKELERTRNAELYYNLMRTPPKAKFELFINKDSFIYYKVIPQNNVPFFMRVNLQRTDNIAMTSQYFALSDPKLNPSVQKEFIFSTSRSINDPQLPKDDIFKVKLEIKLTSIYYGEIDAPDLRKVFDLKYEINRKTLEVKEIGK